jgi:hypothetical protein
MGMSTGSAVESIGGQFPAGAAENGWITAKSLFGAGGQWMRHGNTATSRLLQKECGVDVLRQEAASRNRGSPSCLTFHEILAIRSDQETIESNPRKRSSNARGGSVWEVSRSRPADAINACGNRRKSNQRDDFGTHPDFGNFRAQAFERRQRQLQSPIAPIESKAAEAEF